jgi:hypothetical protein
MTEPFAGAAGRTRLLDVADDSNLMARDGDGPRPGEGPTMRELEGAQAAHRPLAQKGGSICPLSLEIAVEERTGQHRS